jgi:hypothetical protein
MSAPQKRTIALSTIAEGVILIFLAFIALIFTTPPFTPLFMVFFVPILTAYVWETHKKTKELEKRLAALEKPQQESAQQP